MSQHKRRAYHGGRVTCTTWQQRTAKQRAGDKLIPRAEEEGRTVHITDNNYCHTQQQRKFHTQQLRKKERKKGLTTNPIKERKSWACKGTDIASNGTDRKRTVRGTTRVLGTTAEKERVPGTRAEKLSLDLHKPYTTAEKEYGSPIKGTKWSLYP